ncbi:hypothetical protein CTA1_10698 [Colletotrichum tanaceti]|uniref:C3H1-type domain-containing protein n=1 Tax=Colletotrichum tanaceti TaxID=1306861 RepID=A0A4V6DHT7_9PEZI|nr:hypothetical protein CTA1_10698 [Colletotrichum tanaceti]
MNTMSPVDFAYPYQACPSIRYQLHPQKEKRSTCRHFKEGRCIFWQNPNQCRFPHRPQHAPRSKDTGPLYLGYYLNEAGHGGRSPFYCHSATLSPRFMAEPHRVAADYHPQQMEDNYGHPSVPQDFIPGCYSLPTAAAGQYNYTQGFQIYQSQDQEPHDLSSAPPDLSFSITLLGRSSSLYVPHAGDAQTAPPNDLLVNPEKCKRERSKACWYGRDCKKPGCYYRHNAVNEGGEVRFSGLTGAGSEHNVKRANVPVSPTDREFPTKIDVSTEREVMAEYRTVAGDGRPEDKLSGDHWHSVSKRAPPLVVNGTNYRRCAENIIATAA